MSIILLKTLEPASRFFTDEELSSVPSQLLPKEATDHRARNFLLHTFPKVILRNFSDIEDADSKAPDGSQFCLLSYGPAGQIALVSFPPGFPTDRESQAVMHHRVTEVWYCTKGEAIVFLKDSFTESVKKIHVTARSCFMIPVKTHFQFENRGQETVEFMIATAPLWESFADFTTFPSLLTTKNRSLPPIETTDGEDLQSITLCQELKVFFGSGVRPVSSSSSTECIQMVEVLLPAMSTTKPFSSPSSDISIYTLSGKGKISFLNEDQIKEYDVAKMTACTMPPKTLFQIKVGTEPLQMVMSVFRS